MDDDHTSTAEDQRDDTPTDQRDAGPAFAASSAYRLRGRFSHPDGAGVLGRNTATSGTPVGVEGSVPNAGGGLGLATPDDLWVGSVAELVAVAGTLTGGTPVTDLLGDGLSTDAEALVATAVRPDVEDGDTTVTDVTEITFEDGLSVTDEGDGSVGVERD